MFLLALLSCVEETCQDASEPGCAPAQMCCLPRGRDGLRGFDCYVSTPKDPEPILCDGADCEDAFAAYRRRHCGGPAPEHPAEARAAP